MRRTRLIKILDTAALSVSTGKTNIKYTVPYDIGRHDFNLDVVFIVVNGGTSTDLDIHYQYGYLDPERNWTIESKTFSGSGLDDMTTSGTYQARELARYKVEVDSTGGTDTYKWSRNDGESWESELVDMVSGAVELEKGVYITFAATTGHTSGDFWYFHATNIVWVANTTKAIDAMSVASSQKSESETLLPCHWIRFWVNNQDGSNTATVTIYLITQIGE